MKTSPRRRAREFTVQALYQAALNHASAPEVAKNIREAADFKRADADLFTALFFGAHGNSAEYMQIIRPLLDRDEKDINPIERGILLMACHELSAMPETPYPVIINEAIEVTKTFGGTDSHKFINGILDKLSVQRSETRTINKTASAYRNRPSENTRFHSGIFRRPVLIERLNGSVCKAPYSVRPHPAPNHGFGGKCLCIFPESVRLSNLCPAL